MNTLDMYSRYYVRYTSSWPVFYFLGLHVCIESRLMRVIDDSGGSHGMQFVSTQRWPLTGGRESESIP